MERSSRSEGQVEAILSWWLALLGRVFLEVRQTNLVITQRQMQWKVRQRKDRGQEARAVFLGRRSQV